jgi:hypothetical protein
MVQGVGRRGLLLDRYRRALSIAETERPAVDAPLRALRAHAETIYAESGVSRMRAMILARAIPETRVALNAALDRAIDDLCRIVAKG